MPQPTLSEAHLLSAAFSKLRSGCAFACMENHNTPSPTALRRVEYVEHLKHPEHLNHVKHPEHPEHPKHVKHPEHPEHVKHPEHCATR